MSEKKFASEPAPYPQTIVSENKSINTLLGLLDEKYIKSDIKSSDKIPNIDGVIEITNSRQVPQGKVEVQIKTLIAKKKTQTHQCHGDFLAYCKTSILPVILIAVDSENKIAYWLYIDSKVIDDAERRATGDTVSLSFPETNFIDGKSIEYVEKWTTIISGRREKLFQYDYVKAREEQLAKIVAELSDQLEPAISLPIFDLVSIQKFLDCLNFIFDHEFKVVKDNIYPNYWKIGIAIVNCENDILHFFLYPVKYGDTQPLIKQLKRGATFDMHVEYLNDNFILYTGRSRKDLNHHPLAIAYDLLDSDIIKFIKKSELPLDDEFLSSEYLFGFLERYKSVFSYDPHESEFSVQKIQNVLYSLIPAHKSENVSTAPHETGISCYIDDYERWGTGSISRIFSKAEVSLQKGYIPKLQVDIKSKEYDMRLVTYYLNGLNDISIIHRKYRFGVKYIGKIPDKKKWDDNLLVENLKIFWSNFFQIYDKYINYYFPSLSKELMLLKEGENLVVLYVHLANGSKLLELYYVQSNRIDLPKILFYDYISTDAPINRADGFRNLKWYCTLLGVHSKIKSMRTFSLDFLLSSSPSYTLIKLFLGEKIDEFFKKRIQMKHVF